ncbi:MAG: FemAB family XrtA/PEP-CTERM system-associated protein [Aureliella sp.]
MAVEVFLQADSPWPALPAAAVYPQLNAHEQPWLKAISAGLKHTAFLLTHKAAGGEVDGALPLVLVKSPWFGRFLVSLPYVNTGGVWAASDEAAQQLVTRACQLADQHRVRYLELRHEVPVEHPQLGASRTDKVHMRLPLPDSDEALERSFKSKLRSQIKKSKEHGLSIRWGGAELLPKFYDVFAINMRDLGTPVFSRGLFEAILAAFPDSAELCVVEKDARAIAAGLLVHRRGVTEVPSASSLRSYNFTSANMWMYRNLLARAIERGSHTFDFGRSSEGSGTYKFKAQWGAVPHPATWQYYVRKGSAEDMRPDAGGKKLLVRMWQKLPVPISRTLGPSIVRGIP